MIKIIVNIMIIEIYILKYSINIKSPLKQLIYFYFTPVLKKTHY